MLPYITNPFRFGNQYNISNMGLNSVGTDIRGTAATPATSFAWPTANLAMYFPFQVFRPATIIRIAINNGNAVAGNVDAGIYDFGGAKIVTKGSTAQVNITNIQFLDITDTLLNPGLYYMALALSNITGTVAGWTGLTQMVMQGAGCLQQASAFPLPTTITRAVFNQTVAPMINLTQTIDI